LGWWEWQGQGGNAAQSKTHRYRYNTAILEQRQALVLACV